MTVPVSVSEANHDTSHDANGHANAESSGDSMADGGRLAANIIHFARLLRRAGLPVGPAAAMDAIQAVERVGVTSRQDFYWALNAVLVTRRDRQEIFDQAFRLFWRNPDMLARMMGMLLPTMTGEDPAARGDTATRLAEALAGDDDKDNGDDGNGKDDDDGQTERIEFDAALSFSADEKLAERDFEQMTRAELEAARRAARDIALRLPEIMTRRSRSDHRGRRIDLRTTIRDSLRQGGDSVPPRHRRRRRIAPPLVVLCDISGSMERYSRILLHFLHGLCHDGNRVHGFLFGTRLTNITRQLRRRDPDIAIAGVSASVTDWAGGTRIGDCLDDFNRLWSRRVLSRGAVVLLITDGLDRDSACALDPVMERLHKSSGRLIWLNPLLRFGGYRPASGGARAMMAHVDEFHPVHNLDSLDKLAQSLCGPGTATDNGAMANWRALALAAADSHKRDDRDVGAGAVAGAGIQGRAG